MLDSLDSLRIKRLCNEVDITTDTEELGTGQYDRYVYWPSHGRLFC